LLYYRKRLLSLQQEVITMKHQIKQSQRDNQELNS
jgi:cell division protein FtsL